MDMAALGQVTMSRHPVIMQITGRSSGASDDFRARRETLMRTSLLVSLVGLSVLAAGCAEHGKPMAAGQAVTAIVKPNASEFAGIIVTPHLEVRIDPNTSVMWCSTFQLAWNEMCDLAGGPLQIDNAPPMVGVLNRRTATRDDLDDASFLAMAGVGPAIVEKINKELARKFPGKPLARVPVAAREVGENWWIAYAYLLKDLLFEEPFERSSLPMRFLDAHVVTFGATPYDGPEAPLPDEPAEATKEEHLNHRRHRTMLNAQVLIYDYRSGDDFIVELRTKAKDDHLILAKVKPGKTLSETIDLVLKRVGSSRPENMTDEDALKVPVINVDIAKRYDQLIGKTLVQAGMPILDALQVTRFRLDEKGAQLMSLAYLSAFSASPHWMEFDKPYLVLLQRKGAKHPYFALWVANPELMTKVHVERPPEIPPAERAKTLGAELLQDSDPRPPDYRIYDVAEGLARTGKAGVPYLVKGLQSKDAVVRRASASRLGWGGPEARDAAEALAKAMVAEKDDEIVSTMAGAIAKVGPPAEYVPALLKVLGRKGNAVAIEENYRDLVVAIGAPAVPLLVAAMDSGDGQVEHRAIDALTEIGPGATGAIDALVKRMTATNACMDSFVAKALGRIGDVRALRVLLAATRDKDWMIRAHAAEGLGAFKPASDESVHALIALMKDENKFVRCDACDSLRAIGDARVLDAMVAAAGDRASIVRFRVAEALGEIKPTTDQAVTALTVLLKDKDETVRRVACWSLGGTGDARALGAILEAAKDRDSKMRGHAACALGKFKPVTDEAVNALIALLKDKDGRARLNAIICLGNIGPKARRALPELDRISKTAPADSEAQRVAREAYKNIASPKTQPSLNDIFGPS